MKLMGHVFCVAVIGWEGAHWNLLMVGTKYGVVGEVDGDLEMAKSVTSKDDVVAAGSSEDASVKFRKHRVAKLRKKEFAETNLAVGFEFAGHRNTGDIGGFGGLDGWWDGSFVEPRSLRSRVAEDKEGTVLRDCVLDGANDCECVWNGFLSGFLLGLA